MKLLIFTLWITVVYPAIMIYLHSVLRFRFVGEFGLNPFGVAWRWLTFSRLLPIPEPEEKTPDEAADYSI